jgi:putative sterol carrier protein
VLLQARDPVEAIRLRAKFLKVWEKGSLLAEIPEVVAQLQLPHRPAVPSGQHRAIDPVLTGTLRIVGPALAPAHQTAQKEQKLRRH